MRDAEEKKKRIVRAVFVFHCRPSCSLIDGAMLLITHHFMGCLGNSVLIMVIIKNKGRYRGKLFRFIYVTGSRKRVIFSQLPLLTWQNVSGTTRSNKNDDAFYLSIFLSFRLGNFVLLENVSK